MQSKQTIGDGRDIGFIGTFEVANYGDCIFPIVYMHLLRQRLGDCRFSFHSPRAGRSGIADYGPVVALPRDLGALRYGARQLILCGGETLSLGHSSGTYNFPASTLSAFARMWVGPTVAASRGEVDFFVHSVGMPSVMADPKPEIAEALRYATRVSVRDAVTAGRLGNAFPVDVDPVFALSGLHEPAAWQAQAASFLPAGFDPGSYLCAHVSAPYLVKGLNVWCEQVFAAAQRDAMPVLLLPVCHFFDDRRLLTIARDRLVAMGLAPERVQLPGPGSEDVIATAALIGAARGLMTSSLHALVTAVSFAVPFAGFVGLGRGHGKHRQTLLAAGVDFGLADEIEWLDDTLRHAMAQDLPAARDEAIARAMRGFDNLVAALEAPVRNRVPMPEAVLEAVIANDFQPATGLKNATKRTALRFLNSTPLVAQVLDARRISRKIRSVAG